MSTEDADVGWSRDELQAACDDSDCRAGERGGRPKKTDEVKVVTVLPADLNSRFELWCKANEYTKSQAIRHLIRKHAS